MASRKVIKKACSYSYTYSLIESEKIVEDSGMVKVYGIEIIGDDERSLAEDISSEKGKVETLFDLAVEEGLCPVHLMDAAEDLIA